MLKKFLRLSIIFIFCSFLCSCSFESSEDKFDTFTNKLFVEELTSNTINLHFTLTNPKDYGITDYEPSLGDFSIGSRGLKRKSLESYAKQLHKFNPSSLNDQQKIDYEVIDDYLTNQIALCDYELYDELFSPANGIQVQLPLLLAEYKFNSAKDIDDYLCLISQFRKYIDGALEFEKEKSDAGLFMNDSLCIDVIEECEKFIDCPDNNYLITTFDNKINDAKFLSNHQKTDYIETNHLAVCDVIVPAYKQIIKSLTSLLGTGKNNGGLCNYKDGKHFYELLVKRETGSLDSIEDINNAITISRETAINEMNSLLASDSSLSNKCNSSQLSFSNEDEMISTLKNAIKADFPSICDCNCNICFVDSSLSEYLAPAFYITATIDDYYNNSIYINNAKNYSDIKYFTTLAHEGYPGHLYQTVMSYNYGLSPVRSILNYSGYTEGWATYVEMLSYHFAGLDENIATCLQLNQEATLSLYASSDIGIHYLGWNYKDLYKLWSEYGIDDEDTISDIMDYIISEPGNYLKYYVGYLNFKKLKATETNSMAFHEAILRIGPAPFYIIEKYLPKYVDEQHH